METLDSLKSAVGLTHIKIASGLDFFPIELYKFTDTLEVLDLTDNNLSNLPDDFCKFTKLKRLFLSNNQFKHVPNVLSKLPNLSMFGIRNNKIKIFDEDSLPKSIKWLILTDNEITSLPNSIGDLNLLQKCMLSGNKLTSLPNTISKCINLELLRISANDFKSLPTSILSLPKLTWLAYGGNPFSRKQFESKENLQIVNWNEIKLKELLGEGASGHIYKATYENKEVAIKIFKGDMTSDGLPEEEIAINISIGKHENLVDVISKVTNHPDGNNILMFKLIPPSFFNLGLPPSFDSCTRDTYSDELRLSLKDILKILNSMAKAAVHLHSRGIMHGDFYAHNIMIDENANTILGDFGGASYYEKDNFHTSEILERFEVRAFGCLIEELLELSINDGKNLDIKKSLYELQLSCMDIIIKNRPVFSEIYKKLDRLDAVFI